MQNQDSPLRPQRLIVRADWIAPLMSNVDREYGHLGWDDRLLMFASWQLEIHVPPAFAAGLLADHG